MVDTHLFYMVLKGNQQFHVAQVHAFRNRVQFTEAAAAIPKTAILLEIGPHGVLRSPLRQCRPEASHLPNLIPLLQGLTEGGQKPTQLFEGVTPDFPWPTSGCSPPTIRQYQPSLSGCPPVSPPLPEGSGSFPGDFRRNIKPCSAYLAA
jgi:hypothetical protein